MSRFLAWYRKEWREHRLLVLLAALICVLVTVVPYAVDHQELGRQETDRWPLVGVAIATLVLGSDLFAREVRRGPHALILRTPGALRAAFLGKWAFFASATGVALLVAVGTRTVCQGVTGAPHPEVRRYVPGQGWQAFARDLTPHLWWGLPDAVFLPIVAAVAGAWHTVGSIWTSKGGPASVVAILWLLLVGLPFGALWAGHFWCFCSPPHVIVIVLAALAACALLVAAGSWGHGRRYLASGARAWLPGMAAVAVGAGVATLAAHRWVASWESADPLHSEFRITRGYVSPNGRFLYLNTHRGDTHWFNDWTEWGGRLSATRWTPNRPWRVDLEGHDDRVGRCEPGRLYGIEVADWARGAPAPAPWVAFHELERYFWGEHRGTISHTRHVHADDGSVLPGEGTSDRASARSDGQSDPAQARCRDRARAESPYRDASGRPVWWCWRREHEEHGQVEPDAQGGSDRGNAAELWDGWICSPPRPNRAVVLAYAPADGGPVQDLPELPKLEFHYAEELLVTEELRLVRTHSDHELDGPVWGPWALVRCSTGESRMLDDVPKEPDALAVLHRGMVLRLARVGPARRERIVVWHPETDAREPVRCEDATMESPGRFRLEGRAPGDVWLVHLASEREPRAGERHAAALLDARGGVLRPLTAWVAGDVETIALASDGAYVAIEDDRRVVRWRDGGKVREVLFPRPGPN